MYEAYKGLLSIYQKKGESDSIVKYSILCEEALGKWLGQQQFQAIIQSSAMYKYAREKNHAEQNAKDAKISHYIILLLLAIIVIILLLFFIIYKQHVQQRLTKEIEYRKLLETHMNDRIKYQHQKELINSYQTDIQEKEEQLNEEDIVMLFKTIAQGGFNGKKAVKKEWIQLERTFNKYMPHLYAKIQIAQLSQKEIYSCILTYLGFSAHDIFILIDTTPSIVSNLKSSANYKLFGDKSALNLQRNLKKYAYFQI